MSFFELALKNVKGNLNHYIAYLLSNAVAVMLFYCFYAIALNEQFVELGDIHGTVKIAFSVSAIIVAVFSVVFIWFSSNFFIRTRKKEIATYSLLGMTKGQIARMFFYENLLLGLCSMVAGLAIGIMFSKLFGMLLVYVMGQTAQVEFKFVPLALETTMLVFFILFLLNALHGYSLIYRFKLVELFQADKEGEQIPKGSIPATIFAILLIAVGYYLALFQGRSIAVLAIPILLLVIPGTYILFNNAIVFLIGLMRKRKNFYYRGVNLIGISQLFFRIKGNSRMLATIATLSAVTITAVGASFTLYMSFGAIVKDRVPYSLLYKDNSIVDNTVNESLLLHPEAGVESVDHLRLLNAKVAVKAQNGQINLVTVNVMSESQYQQVVKHQQLDVVQSLPNSDTCLTDIASIVKANDIVSSAGKLTMKVGNKTWELISTGKPIHRMLNNGMSQFLTVVVTDQRFKEMSQVDPKILVTMTGIMVQHPEALAGISSLLKTSREISLISTYYDVFAPTQQFFGLLVFIGSFLGLLFFLATGSIIYFKQLMEANDDLRRYTTLRHIGVSKSEIRESVMKQLSVVFALPLIVGIMHSFFALTVLKQLLAIDILGYDLLVTAAYFALYVCYYFITVNSYTKIVMGRDLFNA